MPVIAFSLLDPTNWLLILEGVLGLGMVIFVHELGHFVVAKLCGVKCEKFYLGFDIYGMKLCHWTWGETEYGIGILPLGGYVKMLGQDDNPSKADEERERSHTGEGEALDPRSYLAQSVPERMAIISAGVVMNVIFAFVLSAIAYTIGVREEPCVIGSVLPGEAAWRADLRGGDRILQVGDVRQPRFRDLRQGVMFDSRRGHPVTFIVERSGESQPLTIDIVPDLGHGKPTIGVTGPLTTTLAEKRPLVPVWDETLGSKLKPEDKITAVAGKKVETYAQIREAFTLAASRPIEVSIQRKEGDDANRLLQVSVPPRPMKDLGLTMEMGPISALQEHSPAQTAGVEIGDLLLKIDGQPIGNPLSIPDRLASKAGQTVVLTLKRGQRELEISVPSRAKFGYQQTAFEEDPLSLPSLGLAFPVTTRVAAVSAALGGKIAPGDEVTAFHAVPPKAAIEAEEAREFTLELTSERAWSSVHFILQDLVPGTKVDLTLKGKKEPVVVEPRVVADWFNPDRALNFDADFYLRTAQSVSDDMALATRETKESVTQVYGFLGKLVSRQVSASKNLGGPGTIAYIAFASASAGISSLFIFLAMLSANLAVINFLPIPLLDGGHMAFLILEGLRGKPVSERVIVAFHYAGFVFIIGLMLFVLTLDFQRGWHWLTG